MKRNIVVINFNKINWDISSGERKKSLIKLINILKILEKITKEGDSPVNIFLSCLSGFKMGSFPINLKFDSLKQPIFI